MRITPVQTPLSAVDIAGISAMTSVRSATDPTLGTLWDLSGLAAAQPVHFHPRTPTTFAMVFRRRWYAPTLAVGDPGAYSAYSEDITPGWVLVSAPSGGASTIGPGYAIPTNTPGIRTLVGAASRSTHYLYTLSSDGSTTAVLTMLATPAAGVFTIVGEEIVPNPGDVLFGAGVWMDLPYVVVAGTDSAGQVYLARKPCQAVGFNTPTNVPGRGGTTTSSPAWNYATSSGWSLDPGALAPVLTASGVLTSAGPISYATYKTQSFLSTVASAGAAFSAIVWIKTGPGTPWTQAGTVPLGSDGSYLGGTLQFQQTLAPAPQALWGNATALCWVSSVKAAGAKLLNTWDRWLIDAPSRPALSTGTATLSLPLGLTVSGRAGYFRTPALSGRGQLTASAHSGKFVMPTTTSGHGVLTATTQIYQLRSYPGMRGFGRITVTRAAKKFIFTAPFRGVGTLKTLLGLKRFPTLVGAGRLTASARMYALNVHSVTGGRGVLSAAPVPKLQTSLSGRGALTAAARMYSIQLAARLSGRGLLGATATPRYVRAAAFPGHGALFNALLLQGRTPGTGRLTATAYAKRFQLSAPTSGRGGLAVAYYQLAFLWNATLRGRGGLTAVAVGIVRTGAMRGTGRLTATALQFQAFSEENTTRTNQAVPLGAGGCYVTLLGSGGAGGNGANNDNGGGGGGGGGARVDRVWVPATSMGTTYSVGVGVGGATTGAAGTASTFTSGGVSLSAGGGGGGGTGSSSGGTAGTAGTASASGVTATTHNGTAGAAGSSSGTGGTAASDTTNNVGCGGGGGGRGWGGSSPGGGGGSSNTVTGGAGGAGGSGSNNVGGSAANATAGNGGAGAGGGGGYIDGKGGAGGKGGLYGGGGGGGGGSYNAQTLFGAGAGGYTLVEWKPAP